jgi:hypothetical protein
VSLFRCCFRPGGFLEGAGEVAEVLLLHLHHIKLY